MDEQVIRKQKLEAEFMAGQLVSQPVQLKLHKDQAELNIVSGKHELLRRAIEVSSTAIQKLNSNPSNLVDVLNISAKKLKDAINNLTI